MTTTAKRVQIFQVMGPSGDEEFEWDADDPADVSNAKQKFNKLKLQGYIAYRRTAKGKGEQVREFDPLIERIIFTPPMRGG